MAKVSLDDLHSHVSTADIGMFHPYYCLHKRLTRDSDTYSFGVMVLEVLSGRRAIDNSRPVEERILPSWALYREAREILDPVFHGNLLEYSREICCDIAKRCLNQVRKKRPEMSEVLAQLELALFTSQYESVNQESINCHR